MRRVLFAFLVVLAGVPSSARAQVAVQTYALPSGGGFPHDVAVGSDGIVWYTAQRDGKLYLVEVRAYLNGAVVDQLETEFGITRAALPTLARTLLAGGPFAVYAGDISGTGVGAELAPGDFLDIAVLVGTASCDPALGYRLPPGRYEVRTPVDQYEYPGGEFEQHAILSSPTPLVITP